MNLERKLKLRVFGKTGFARWIASAIIGGLLAYSGAANSAPEGSPWNASYFPNVALTTQDGQVVHFYDDLIKDKVVAINFIFTSCTDVCPAETAKLRQVQTLLGDRVGRDVFFYSISIDPKTDTPAVMKAYARKFDVQPGWLFLTGKPADIALLRKKLGLLRPEGETAKADHNSSLIVGNEATGQWMKRSSFDNSQVLAGVIGGWLHNWKVADTAPKQNYADASRIAAQPQGEKLFRTRCVSCHSIGGGNGLGPDLLGIVDKRNRGWLMRWLKAPDQMIAEKDPTALALYAKYGQLKMPNFRFADEDASALIEYMQAQSQIVAGTH